MTTRRDLTRFFVALMLLCGVVLTEGARNAPLEIEATGRVETLAATYPAEAFLVHDHNFFYSKIFLINAAGESLPRQFMGMFDMGLTGGLAMSMERGEFYAAETFYSRGTRGERTDVITIWNSETLNPVAEILLPAGERYVGMPERFSMQVLNGEQWLAVANFSPATSVTLIDLERREIIAKIATPGCALIYPTGPRGFSSLCADGRFMSTQLAADGALIKQTRIAPFFNSDTSPVFERPAIIDETGYFPSFAGLVYPVDMSGAVAVVGEPWHLSPEKERAENWAPGGLGIIDRDDLGHFYILMHPASKEGSHNSGGSEVWVFDPAKQQRILRIPLQQWGVSLAVSGGEQPLLLVTNPTDMSLEAYNAIGGEFIRKITDFGQETPLMLHAIR